MPRNFAQVKVSIWDDLDFVALDADAQRLYFVLMTRAELSLAGTLPWHAGRIAQLAKDTTPAQITRAAGKLERARFIAIDKDTDECLLRAQVRYDEVLYRGIKLAAGVLSAWRSVYSHKLKEIIASEVLRADGVSGSVMKVLEPMFEWASDTPFDTPPDEVSGQPTTNNQLPATGIGAKSPRGSHMTTAWTPSEKCHETVGAEFADLDLPLQLDSFRDYWISKGDARKDWDAAFRNWCRKAREFNHKPTNGARRTAGLSDEDWQAAFNRVQAGDLADAMKGRAL